MAKTKRNLILFVGGTALFVLCCLAMTFAHSAISAQPVTTYAFLAIWGLSAIVMPVFLVKFLGNVLASIAGR